MLGICLTDISASLWNVNCFARKDKFILESKEQEKRLDL